MLSVSRSALGRSIGFWAALPGSGVGESLGAGSPFTHYTAAVVVYVLLAGVLITGLLLGAFLLINLGLLSKRREDRVGRRDPSDVGILREGVWPEEAEDRAELPAEEEGYFPSEGDEDLRRRAQRRLRGPDHKRSA